jgi:ATP-dependent DNA helicase Rep
VIAGCEEGLLPHLGPEEDQASASRSSMGLVDDQQVIEERRLMYVAVTRARKSLTLSWAQERKKQRQLFKQMPSRFIEEMGLNPREDSLAKTASKHQALDQVAQLRKLLLKTKV